MIYVFLADGFEEVEALAPVDILRRAGLQVRTVGVTGEYVTGAHGIRVAADVTAADLDEDIELIILPGGMPGTTNLQASPMVGQAIEHCAAKGIRMAAICAAPLILGDAGLLQGKRAVCFPGFEEHLTGAQLCAGGVVTDGSITTAKSAGHAIAFGIELVRLLCGEEKAHKTEQALMQL